VGKFPPRVRFVVETFLAYDRPTQTPSPEWVQFRLRWFVDHTLRSLRAQTWREFEIFVQTGERYRDLVNAFAWPDDVRVCRQRGREAYQEGLGRYDFLSMTRIDSDDLFRQDAMDEVRAAVLSRLPVKERTVLVFPARSVWDAMNGLIIGPHTRPSSPFFTHIFPYSMVADWPAFQAAHFCGHGSGGAGDRGAMHLSRDKVMVVKHGWNWSNLKRGKSWPKKAADLEKLQAQFPGVEVTCDPARIAAILSEYGQ